MITRLRTLHCQASFPTRLQIWTAPGLACCARAPSLQVCSLSLHCVSRAQADPCHSLTVVAAAVCFEPTGWAAKYAVALQGCGMPLSITPSAAQFTHLPFRHLSHRRGEARAADRWAHLDGRASDPAAARPAAEHTAGADAHTHPRATCSCPLLRQPKHLQPATHSGHTTCTACAQHPMSPQQARCWWGA